MALPDEDGSGDDYDRDEDSLCAFLAQCSLMFPADISPSQRQDFDGDYKGAEGLELKGPEELAMDRSQHSSLTRFHLAALPRGLRCLWQICAKFTDRERQTRISGAARL